MSQLRVTFSLAGLRIRKDAQFALIVYPFACNSDRWLSTHLRAINRIGLSRVCVQLTPKTSRLQNPRLDHRSTGLRDELSQVIPVLV